MAQFLAVALILTAQFAASPAQAGNDTWNGNGTPDGNWSNAANWDTAPAAGDFLNFDTGNQTASTNDFAAGTIFGNLGFNPSAGAFTLSGNGIILTNGADGGNGTTVGGSISNLSNGAEIIALPVTYSAGNHIITTVSARGSLT